MTPRTVPIVCGRAPRHIVYVPAVRQNDIGLRQSLGMPDVWRCSYCNARVRVVA